MNAEEGNKPVKKYLIDDVLFGEWQLCPKCNGKGEVYEQRGVPGLTGFSIGFFTCDVCNGAKILARPVLSSQTPTIKQ